MANVYTPSRLKNDEKEMIDVPLLKKWIAELRNPENKQARGTLSRKRKDGKIGRCCLGLACVVAGMTEKEPTDKQKNIHGLARDQWIIEYKDAMFISMPPYELNEKLGITRILSDLVSMNDERRSTYKVIANFVEKYMRENGVL